MKRIVSILLILAVVVGMVFANGKTETSSSGKQPEVVVLGNARMYDGENEAWAKMIEDFESETGIKVTLRFQGKTGEVVQNLQAAQLAGEQVDIVTIGANAINSLAARSGLLMDITDLMDPYKERFNDGMLDPYTIGDRLWGFPYGNSAAGFIYYNKTMFDELGLKIPETYSDLVDIAKVIKEKKGITPMTFRGKDSGYWSNFYMVFYAQTSNNQPLENTYDFLTNKRNFTSDAEINALKAMKAFFDDGILSTESLDTNGDGMKASFLQQKTAMFYSHNFQLLQKDCPDFELGIFAFPIIVDGTYSQAFGGPGTGIAIPSFANRDNLDNTMKFIEFMLRPEYANLCISCYKPVAEVVKGVKLVDDPNIKYLNEVLIPNTLMYLDWIWPSQVNSAICNAIPAVITGNMTAEEAAASVQKALSTLETQDDYVYDWWNTWTKEDWEKVRP